MPGVRDRAGHSRATRAAGGRGTGRGPRGRARRATRDRVTARYLWDTAREIIEARCAAISRRSRIVQQILEIRRAKRSAIGENEPTRVEQEDARRHVARELVSSRSAINVN